MDSETICCEERDLVFFVVESVSQTLVSEKNSGDVFIKPVAVFLCTIAESAALSDSRKEYIMKKVLICLASFLLFMALNCDKNNYIYSPSDKEAIVTPSLLKSIIATESGNIVFGPEAFGRAKGNLSAATREFTITNIESKYLFILQNGDNTKDSKVSNCSIVINKHILLNLFEQLKNKNRIEKEIILSQRNRITVLLVGKPTSFITLTIVELSSSPSTVTDIDGNIYKTVKIGDQCWMAENLKVTHFRNGDAIPNVTDNNIWINLTSGALCNYSNDEAYVSTYGRLYNWYAIQDSRNIAPNGWHVPSDSEWQTLIDFLGGNNVAGGKMKEAGTQHWNSPNTDATNESGFTALPSGARGDYVSPYGDMGNYTYYWTSTEWDINTSIHRTLYYNSSAVGYVSQLKRMGLSIRCVKD